MRAYLATNVMGSFVFDKEGNLIDKRLFPKNPEAIAEKLDNEGMLPEEDELLSELAKKGYKETITDRKIKHGAMSVVLEEENPGKKALQDGFRGLAIRLKWANSQAELNEILSKVNVLRTRGKLREEGRDRIVMRVSGVLEELEKELNTFSELLREWYGLHFPELSKEVQSHERFAELVAGHGSRWKVGGFEKLAEASGGMVFSGLDMKQVQDFASEMLGLFRHRTLLEKYLEGLCREVAPNTSRVAGHILAARLLSHAGGLEKLARLPSSTVQLLGAEKSLFRHLKDRKSRPPKYGVLFAHPLVQGAPKEKRGKAARLVAAKVSLAARTDFYSKEDRGEPMRKELEEQARELGFKL